MPAQRVFPSSGAPSAPTTVSEAARRRAAEQLVDITYALTAGRPLEPSSGGAEAGPRVPEDVRAQSETRSDGDRVEIAVLVSRPV